MSISQRGKAVVRLCMCGLIAGCAWLIATSQASAQITVQAVLGKSVHNTGAEYKEYKEVQDAITRFTNNDVAAARSFLQSARTKWPRLPPAELMLAQMWALANQPAQYRAELETCIKDNPDDPDAYLMLGDQAFGERRVAESELLFLRAKVLTEKFVEGSPPSPNVNFNALRKKDMQVRSEAGLAAVAEAREQWDAAERHLRAWLAIVDPVPADDTQSARNPESANAHDRLGRVLFKEDTKEGPDAKKAGAKAAYAEFKAALKADENSISPDIAMAQLFEEAKMHKDAMSHVAIAMSTIVPPNVKPEQLPTALAAAHWALETDQPHEAYTYADTGLKIDPTSLEAKFCRGVAARLLKDVKQAEKDLTEVCMASPSNFSASDQLAQILAEQNDKLKRQRAFEIASMNNQIMASGQNAQRQPDKAIESAATLGWVLFNMQRINEADQVMAQIIKTGLQTGILNADSYYYAAKILKYHGQDADARKFLKRALEISKAFVHHQDASDLLAQIGAGPDDSGSTDSSTNTTPDKSPASGAGDTDSKKPTDSGSK